MGGVTDLVEQLEDQEDDAAMEPAADGRGDHVSLQVRALLSVAPQWSPPLMGGVTRRVGEGPGASRRAAMEPAADGRGDGVLAADLPRRRRVAAMEPAADGRGDLPVRRPHLLNRHAAMEPAADGRGDIVAAASYRSVSTWPQWSPPLMGGVTITPASRCTYA